MSDFAKIPLGAKPDPKDKRDIFKASAPCAKLPGKAQVKHLPPIKDQGRQSSCTGHAVAWMMEQIFLSRGLKQGIALSPLFPWYYARADEGVQDRDEGVSMRSIMSAVHHHGIPALEKFPYGTPLHRIPETDVQIYAEAFRLPRYERCDTIEKIKYAIAMEDQSVCIGLPIFQNWYSRNTVRTGMVPYDSHADDYLGGHAMVVCGYDDRRKVFILANSWSTRYGHNGYVFVPYEYLEHEDFDAWTAGFEDLPGPIEN